MVEKILEFKKNKRKNTTYHKPNVSLVSRAGRKEKKREKHKGKKHEKYCDCFVYFVLHG